MGAGIDALRDAGIPLVRHYRTTSVGTQLPDRWMLPDDVRDGTGVIFASAFPGYNDLADELTRFGIDNARREELAALEAVRAKVAATDGDGPALAEIDRRIHDLQLALDHDGYTFDRRFLFRVLSMGHSQFAELIGARGPNTQVNAACASTTQAVALAEDWIRPAGASASWSSPLTTSRPTTSSAGWAPASCVGRRRHGRERRGRRRTVRPPAPRDDPRHGRGRASSSRVRSRPASAASGRSARCSARSRPTAPSTGPGSTSTTSATSWSRSCPGRGTGAVREEMAPATVFISHETYTPARGGSAAAEVNALRRVFGAGPIRWWVANTKGFTGHPMGVGIEDVVAVKALETGIVPPVPNFKEPDPDLGELNLSIGGVYPCATRCGSPPASVLRSA